MIISKAKNIFLLCLLLLISAILAFGGREKKSSLGEYFKISEADAQTTVCWAPPSGSSGCSGCATSGCGGTGGCGGCGGCGGGCGY